MATRILTAGALKMYNEAISLNKRLFLRNSPIVTSTHIFLGFITISHPLGSKFLQWFKFSRHQFEKQLCEAIIAMDEEAQEEECGCYFQTIDKLIASKSIKAVSEWNLFTAVFEMANSDVIKTCLSYGVKFPALYEFLALPDIQEMAEAYESGRSTVLDGLNDKPTLQRTGSPIGGFSQQGQQAAISSAEVLSASQRFDVANYTRNLSELARQGQLGRCFFRDHSIAEIMEALCREQQKNVLLVGDMGVGKSAVVAGLAHALNSEACPGRLSGRQILQVEPSELWAGAHARGELEKRLFALAETCRQRGNIILYFEEFATFFCDKDNYILQQLIGILTAAMMRGDVQCLGATTPAEYRKLVESDSLLSQVFTVVHVEAPSAPQTIEILANLRNRLERYHKVEIGDDAIQSAVEFSEKHLKDRALPGKAISVLDSASARASLKQQIPRVVHREDVAEIISRLTRTPLSQVLATRIQNISRLKEILQERIIGQNRAIETIVDRVQVARSGLDLSSHRPDAVFLLCGPTGVGKTELARALSVGLTGSADKLVRFDMSEFMEKHTVAKLIGAPPGYVGYQEEGQLTGRVRNEPQAVILFDEVEKAHADVYNLFLQMFDAGRLTDSRGVTTDFSQTIILMTSNLGVRDLEFEELMSLPQSERFKTLKNSMQSAVRDFFSPEFLNRLDDIIYLDFLVPEVIAQIANQRVLEIFERISKRGKKAEMSGKAFDFLVVQGFSAEYGARYLNRTIENLLLKPLAKFMLEHDEVSSLRIELEEDRLVFLQHGNS